MAAKKKEPEMPKSLGAAADLWWELRTQRLAADKAAAELKDKEQAVEAYLINTIDSDSTGVAGKNVAVRRIEDEVPVIENWDTFIAGVARKKNWHLLQHRLSVSAAKEMLEDGQKIAGVGTIVKVKLGYTQVK